MDTSEKLLKAIRDHADGIQALSIVIEAKLGTTNDHLEAVLDNQGEIIRL